MVSNHSAAQDVNIRSFQPGDAGYVAYLHATLYKKIYGFKGIFEYYVMKGLTEFLHDSEGGNLWVAEQNGRIIGSIAIVKAEEEETAQLRWFIMDDAVQGQGVGGRLLKKAVDFCADRGYRHVFLWTIDILGAARHLYQKYGFKLTERKSNDEWTAVPLTEERWDLHTKSAGVSQ